MFHISTAVVPAGDDTAVFPISLLYAHQAGNFRIKPVSLVARPKDLSQRYVIELRLNFQDGENVYSSFISPFKAAGVKPAVFGQKLASGFFTKAREHYPANILKIPRIVARELSAVTKEVQFQVVLPAFTALYSDNPDLWRFLGFNNFVETLEHTGTVQKAPNAVPYGWVNLTPGEQTADSKVFSKNEELDMLYQAYFEESAAIVESKQFKIELQFLSEWLTVRTNRVRPVSRVVATQTLSDLIDQGLKDLSLDPGEISVQSEGDESIAIESRETPGSKLVLEIRFSKELTGFFQLEDPVLHFPLGEKGGRHLSLETANQRDDDMLRDSYPVVVMLRGGGGEATCSFIEGYGVVPLLSVMHDETTFLGEGAVFRGSQLEELKIRLLDLTLKPVVKDVDVNYILTLELTQF